jgi:hypothetical protein
MPRTYQLWFSKQQWEPYDPGFKLCAPLMKRPPGRPRTKRIRARSEGGRLGARKIKCRRCGGFGHTQRICKESVDPAFGEEGYGEPEQEPEPYVVAKSARYVYVHCSTFLLHM